MMGPVFTIFKAHGILGTIIFGFSIIQIVVAILRPHKETGQRITDARYAFELFHHWNGRILVLAALVQIYLGIDAIGYDRVYPWINLAYVILVAVILGIILIVEIFNCVSQEDRGIVPCCVIREPSSHEYKQAEFL